MWMPQRLALPKILIVLLLLIILNGSILTVLRHPLSLWLFLPLLGILKISLSSNHALLILLRLEIISISCLIALALSHVLAPSPLFIFTVMTLAVCEARLGLSLLVRHARRSGSELVPFFILKLSKLKTFKVFIAAADLLSIIIIINFQLKDKQTRLAD